MSSRKERMRERMEQLTPAEYDAETRRLDAELKVRKGGDAKPTQAHRDRTKYRRNKRLPDILKDLDAERAKD